MITRSVGIKVKKLRLIILAILASIFSSHVYAADPADVQRLKDTRSCGACNLSGAYLSGTYLGQRNLSAANLQKADLRGANLSGANLEGANLSGAIMNGVIFCNTIMPDGSVIYSGC